MQGRQDPSLNRFRVEGTLTGRKLGTGSYGSVEEIIVNNQLCAGKQIHEVLVDMGNDGGANIAEKFLQECELMSNLDHPNIAQFLGLCYFPDKRLPVLVMERLEGSLDDLLVTVPEIPLIIKRQVLENIARGLLYLHQEEIIHRDLTAKNVVLTSSLRAKITDLGNSRIVNFQPGQLARTLSRLPGTLVYMAPEAIATIARYGPSLDIFSFGHLSLYTMIQQFPGNLLEPTFRDPDRDNSEGLVARSEVERRGSYFEEMERRLPNWAHELFEGVIVDCLSNEPSERPTAMQVLTSLEGMEREVIDNNHQNMDEEINRAVQGMRNLPRPDLPQRPMQTSMPIAHTRSWKLLGYILPLIIAAFLYWVFQEEEISTLRRKLHLKQAHFANGGISDQTRLSEPLLPLKLEWKNATESMPFDFSKPPYVVEIKGKVYIGGGESSSQFESEVIVYDLEKDTWSKLPPYQYKFFALTVLNDSLVVVGGIDKISGKRTSTIGLWSNYSKTWSFPFPAMPTVRSLPTVTSYDNRFLIIAGGRDDEKKQSRVDILDTVHLKWYEAAPHPAEHTHMSSVTVGNMWYLMSGFAKSAKGASKRVFCVCLDDLTYKHIYSQKEGDSPWQSLHDTPLKRSTALAIDGALLAFGGNGTSIIHVYKPSSDVWEQAAEISAYAGKSCVYHSISNNSKIFVSCYEDSLYGIV